MAEQHDLFREEALAHHAQYGVRGDVLRISPAWTRWTYWLLCAACAAGLLFAALGSVYQYASGPAVIRVEGRVELTARAAGPVGAVEVQPGQRVHVGQTLVRFFDAAEAAELERIKRETDLLLLRLTRDPLVQEAQQALASLRARREQAEARLREREVQAPIDGVVSDVRIRPGQQLQAGDTVLSLLRDGARFSLLALLPGHARPLLRQGQTLRVELQGYRSEYRELTIDRIGNEVIGPAEARRMLPPQIADAVVVQGPVVPVQADLPGSLFAVDGHSYRYHDGMIGTVQARLRKERLLLTLVPGLKVVLPHE